MILDRTPLGFDKMCLQDMSWNPLQFIFQNGHRNPKRRPCLIVSASLVWLQSTILSSSCLEFLAQEAISSVLPSIPGIHLASASLPPFGPPTTKTGDLVSSNEENHWTYSSLLTFLSLVLTTYFPLYTFQFFTCILWLFVCLSFDGLLQEISNSIKFPNNLGTKLNH